jgi:hypothetical protein
MPTEEKKSHVENIRLAPEMEKEVAMATVRIGDVLIRGVRVWKSPQGKLRVFFPGHKLGPAWEDTIDLSSEVRSEVEADVIAAYKDTKAQAERKSQDQTRTP